VEPDNFRILGVDRGGAISVILGAIVTITLCTTLLLVNRRQMAQRREADENED
jgi:hypothetical protein